MLFCTREFLAFFVAVLALHWALPRGRPRALLLLAASVYFHASWSAWLTLVVLASATADYVLARGLDASASPRTRRLLVTASVAGNLCVLGWFKYSNFFLRTIEDTLRLAGYEAQLPVLSLLLLVGISFYTFEAIDYVLSVYRREIPAERDLPRFLLFIFFFPRLVAGPIVRARDFLPQTYRARRWSWPRANLGVQLCLLGLFKKLVVADRLALCVDPVFADPASFERAAAWCATLAYSLQLYCDFSGYSDLALGLAHLLGYRLPLNFDLPYLARNVSEFWRRWHISLSTWLRNNLFIPLGGSRRGPLRTALALVVTMTLGGLWHGASRNFLAWGLLHGLLLVAHRAFVRLTRSHVGLERALESPWGVGLRIATTFTVVSLGWVLFRAPTFPAAEAVFRRLAVAGPGAPAPQAQVVLQLALLVAAGHMLAVAGAGRWLARAPAPLQGLAYGGALALTLLLAPPDAKAFIYFQF